MYLINISSNINAKFYIGSALTRLNELGDMYVSAMYQSADSQGSQYDYANCCIQLDTTMDAQAILTATKAIETSLGRGSITVEAQQVVIDIDILAHATGTTDKRIHWNFDACRLPLTRAECWALNDIDVVVPETHTDVPAVLSQWQL